MEDSDITKLLSAFNDAASGGGSYNISYWTGGDSAYTPSFKNGELNLYGNLDTLHQVGRVL
jgi:hypothetical protein